MVPGPLPSESKYVFIKDSVITESGLGATFSSYAQNDIVIDITGLTPGRDVIISFYANKDGSGPAPVFHAPSAATFKAGISTTSSTEDVISGMRIYSPTYDYTRLNIKNGASNTSYSVMAYQA